LLSRALEHQQPVTVSTVTVQSSSRALHSVPSQMALFLLALFFAVATCSVKFAARRQGVDSPHGVVNPLDSVLLDKQFQGHLDDSQWAEFQSIVVNMDGDLQSKVLQCLHSLDDTEWGQLTDSLSVLEDDDVDSLLLFLQTVDSQHWNLMFDAMGHLDTENTHHLFSLMDAVSTERWSELFDAVGTLESDAWNQVLGSLDSLQPADWNELFDAMDEPMDDDRHWAQFLSYLSDADLDGVVETLFGDEEATDYSQLQSDLNNVEREELEGILEELGRLVKRRGNKKTASSNRGRPSNE